MIRRTFTILRRHFRRRRYLQIRDLLEIERRAGFILDFGGGRASFFADMFPRPKQVILLDVDYNRALQAKRKQSALLVIVADGKKLPFADGSVEILICNSVIEHLDDPASLASEIRRISRGYFLQTPYKGFPLETHSSIAIPFYNLIPSALVRRFICKIVGANFDYVSSVHYLSEEELKTLFPKAKITYEKVLGLKKSFYVHYLNEVIDEH